MRSQLGLLSLTFLFLCLSACTPATEQPEAVAEEVATTEADMAAIETLRADFVTAYNAEDIDGLLSLFAADAVRMPPDEPALSGTEELRGYFSSRFELADIEVSIANDETEVAGDWAFARGNFGVRVTPAAGGESVEYTGKWINIMQRQADGSWKISHNIYNNDAPVEPFGE
jgi:ketosteroid isomerase-like protein